MKLTGYNTWEGQVTHVKKGEHLAKPVIIGNIYRPPRDLIEGYREFIDEFNPILNRLEANNCDVTLTGVFNIDLLKINEKQIIGECFDIFTNHSFFPKTTLPTRLYIKNKGNIYQHKTFKMISYSRFEIQNLKVNPILNPNINYNILHDLIQAAKNNHMPSRVVKFNKYKHKNNKWISNGIIKSIRFRVNLNKIHKMTKQNSVEYFTQSTNLKTYNTT